MENKKLADNDLVRFLDSILPYFQLSLNNVKEAITIYNLKKSTRANMYGDTIQMCTEPLNDCLYYFPACKEEVGQLMGALCIDKRSPVPLVRLLDVLILLTIISRGRMKEKSELLFSFFAVAEPEGMLEYEHAGLIFSVANCLKRIGAMKHLDMTEEDAAHLAFLARIRSDGQGFYPSLSFSEFFHWIQNSTESNLIFTFIRQINRLLEICVSMDSRIDALASMLTDITTFSDKGIGLPKLDNSSAVFVERTPQLIFLSADSASFLLPREPTAKSDLFVQIDYVHHPPHQRYELAKRLRSKHRDLDPQKCCDKTYMTPSRRKVYSPPLGRSFANSRSDAAVAPCVSMRVDVVGDLQPETEYRFTFYSSFVRFPPLLVKMPPAKHTAGGSVSGAPCLFLDALTDSA
jgi:hypothetical protein